MRLPASDTTAIHQLRLRHPGAADPTHLIDAMRRAIEWADWPRAPAGSWVFVRRLEAAAPADQLARSLASAARAQLQHGDSANVVRFADLAELLASLLSDLAGGEAAARWYWRRWSHLFTLPASRAAADLMIEHLPHLPSVCARLSCTGALARVWSALDEPEALNIAQALARHVGFALPGAAALAAERAIHPQHAADAPRVPLTVTVRNRWSALLHRLPPQDWRSVTALTLIAMEIAPLQLRRAPAQLLARLGAALQPAPVPVAPLSRRNSGSAAQTQARPARSDETRSTARDSVPALPPDRPRESRTPAASTDASFAHVTPSVGPTPRSAGRSHAAAKANRPPAEAATTQQPESVAPPPATGTRPVGMAETSVSAAMPLDVAPFTEFVTQQGGLFYLLNFLDRDEAREIMEQHAAELPSGWSWLYHLGQELELNEADPVVPFLAEQMGLEPRDLAMLPPIPPRAISRLRSLAARWYGRIDLWRPALLRLDARVRTTPSHLDLHASLNAVQLPVRLAGLDVNPGWLPWLGRVVTFHYE